HLAGAGDFEALFGAGFRLHLGHLGHLLDRPETDARAPDRGYARAFCWSMIFSENRWDHAQFMLSGLAPPRQPFGRATEGRLYGRSAPKWQPPEPGGSGG